MAVSKTHEQRQHALFDPLFFAAVAVLMGLGLTMVLSSSGIKAEQVFGDPYHFFKRQALFLGMSLGIIFFTRHVPIRFVFRTIYIWLGLVFVLLILTLSPLGFEAGGAQRWLRAGPFSLQPLELAKVVLVLYFAYFFSTKQDRVTTFHIGFLPPALITCLMVGLLILQPDFGGAVFLMLLFFLMAFAGGVRLFYLFCMFVFSAITGCFMVLGSSYRLDRFLAIAHPFQNADGSAYQIVQSLYGLAVGGVSGLGLGEGRQKLFFLPEAHTDFILAVLGEELGFVGISVVFLCFGYILFKMLVFTVKDTDDQSRLAGFGLSLVLIVGFFLHTAVVLGVIPPKGLALPFLSYGGSSLLCSSVCVGLLLSMTRQKRKTS